MLKVALSKIPRGMQGRVGGGKASAAAAVRQLSTVSLLEE